MSNFKFVRPRIQTKVNINNDVVTKLESIDLMDKFLTHTPQQTHHGPGTFRYRSGGMDIESLVQFRAADWTNTKKDPENPTNFRLSATGISMAYV
jgi:hypothetical protein